VKNRYLLRRGVILKLAIKKQACKSWWYVAWVRLDLPELQADKLYQLRAKTIKRPPKDILDFSP